MQSKVSIVVPCYNKENYIGAMIESVLAQKWDNIELLLVNDGSTDGTRSVIESYLPKLEKRGYLVKLIDQENGGCCKAVYTGLKNMTGDYFCLVDADDEILPTYISSMANWLDGHDDYEWVCCSYQVCLRNDDGSFAMQPMTTCSNMSDNNKLLERHIIRKVITASWIYMTRVSYINQTGLIDMFCTERRKTYEPLFAVPLMLGSGKLKTIDEPLYKFNRFGSDMYYFDTYDKVVTYYTDYSDLYRHCIEKADISDSEKRRFRTLIDYGYRKDILYHLNNMDRQVQPIRDAESYLEDFAKSFVDFIDEIITPPPHCPKEMLMNNSYVKVTSVVDDIVLSGSSVVSDTSVPKLIGYGVLGKVAKCIFPMLDDAKIQFDYLWDKGSSDEMLNGVSVAKPNFKSVNDNDIIVVFPKSWEILVEVARNSGNAKIIFASADNDIVNNIRFSKMFWNRTFVKEN